MIKSEGKPLEVDFFSIGDEIHEKVCLCAPRGPTHGPAFACRDKSRAELLAQACSSRIASRLPLAACSSMRDARA